MTQLRFTIKFLGPFAVTAGIAQDGLDATIDRTNVLPSTELKGLVRAHLSNGLGASDKHVLSIFHPPDDEVRWVWSNGQVDVSVNSWFRIMVDDYGRSEERAFMLGEQAHAKEGSFTVTWEGRGEPPRGEVLAIRAGARMVTSLGSYRRRGMGWVSIIDNLPWDLEDTRELRKWLASDIGGAK